MVDRPEIIIFGAAILDIPAGPVDTSLLTAGSVPADRITMNTGGDALNEATVLAKLGKSVRLVSKIGNDMAGRSILDHCRYYGMNTDYILVEPGLDTGITFFRIWRRLRWSPNRRIRMMWRMRSWNAVSRL
ncbi:carbohydrate kinase family protein [Diplocloster modestus]|uniref:carbohydrate kinase family protein n=1 Tax=Diplocloster modestus TaxID=2850322 RepID=UPI001EE82B32|nr:carbohydrate kinase family protein [Diplocloster modestus]